MKALFNVPVAMAAIPYQKWQQYEPNGLVQALDLNTTKVDIKGKLNRSVHVFHLFTCRALWPV
jgi:hypothetical protein